MIIEAVGMSCAYDGRDVVAEATVRVAAGEFVGVVGPNGSGKSTLLRALSRVLRPRLGHALLDGQDLYGLPARDSARAIGVVPQESPLDFDFTCEEVVRMGRAPHLRRFRGESEADIAAVSEAMERTDTMGHRDRLITELSGGERQRVILARAFAQAPRLLLLDEPTSHLDVSYQVQILRIVKDLQAEKKTAVLAVLHDLNLAAAYSDRILILHEGRIVAQGPPAETLQESLLRQVFGNVVSVRPHPEAARPLILLRT